MKYHIDTQHNLCEFNMKISVIFMFLYNYFRIINFSNVNTVVNFSVVVTISLYGLLLSLIPNLLFARYRWNLLYIFLAFVAIFLSNFDGVTNYVTIIITAAALANHDIRPYVKAIFYSLIFGVVTILILRFSGFIPDRIAISPRGVTRYSFGFGSARGLAENYLTFSQLFIYLYFDRFKRSFLVILFIPMLFINHFTDSRASLLLTLLLFMTIWLLKTKGKSVKITLFLYRVANLAYSFSFIGIYLCSYFYKKSHFWNLVDSFVSSRFQFGRWYLNYFPPKFLGQQIPIDLSQDMLISQYNTNYLMLDSGYMTMLLEGGIMITVVMSIIILVTFKRMKDKNNDIGLLVWIISALNLFQTRFLNPATLEVLLLSQAFELTKKDNSNNLLSEDKIE